MAVSVVSGNSPLHDVDADVEELSDDEIQRLLVEAEVRLKTAAEAKRGLKNDLVAPHDRVTDVWKPSIRPLSQLKYHPYVRSKDGVAQTDPGLLIDKKQRKLADNLRSVETRVNSKKVVCELA